MMGCPVHIWAPLMASMVPFTRVARDRLTALRSGRKTEVAAEQPRELQRWAPVQPRPQAPRETAAE
jgi:hypothetical protein